MSGLPWIKVWTVVPQHPKIQRLERELAIRDALGMVVRLWCWTAAYHPDGDIPSGHADSMAEVIAGDAVPADPDGRVTRNARVTQACVTAGLLDPLDTGFRVHDWHEMQTVHVEAEEKRKAQTRERQARFRERHNVTVTRDGNALRNVDSVTEIEKEREKEKKKEASGKQSASPPLPPASPLASWLAETYPDIRDPNGFEAAEREANPGTDLLLEAKKARAWEVANPERRKRRHAAFLSRWFARAQDRPGKRNGTSTTEPARTPDGKAWPPVFDERLPGGRLA